MNLCYTNLFNRSLKTIKKDQNHLKNLNIQLKINVDLILCFDVSHISGSSAVGSAIYYDKDGFDKKTIENTILLTQKNQMITLL